MVALAPDPTPWYKSGFIRACTAYAAAAVVAWAAHRKGIAAFMQANNIDAGKVQDAMDWVLQVGGVALSGYLAKKRLDYGNPRTPPPSEIVGSQAKADRLSGDVPIQKQP